MRGKLRSLITGLACVAVAGARGPGVTQATPRRPMTAPPEAGSLTLAAGSRLWFDGKSTVRDWSCSAPVLEAKVETAGSAATAAVLNGAKAVTGATLSVPTMQLDCDNGTMNGHMRKALEAERHAAITFTLDRYELAGGDSARGTLEGMLVVKGIGKPITLPVEIQAGPDDALRVTGHYALRMTDWGVKPPKLMLGTLKVNEMVDVRFDLLLTIMPEEHVP